MLRVLIVESRADIARNITRESIDLGYVCNVVVKFEDFKATLETFSPDLVILELAQNRESGLDYILHLANVAWPGYLAITCSDDSHLRDRMDDLAMALGLKMVETPAASDDASEIRQILEFVIARRPGRASPPSTSSSSRLPDRRAQRRVSNG